MGDMADYYIELALNQGEWADGWSRGGTRRSTSKYKAPDNSYLDRDFWMDAKGHYLYPSNALDNNGMTLEHIEAVKKILLERHGSGVRSSLLWCALEVGERKKMQEAANILALNKGVLKL